MLCITHKMSDMDTTSHHPLQVVGMLHPCLVNLLLVSELVLHFFHTINLQ